MPIKRARPSSVALRKVLDELSPGWLSAKVCADPEYPTCLVPSGGPDDYWDDLLLRVQQGANVQNFGDEEGVQLLRPRAPDDKLAPGLAVCRTDELVVQIVGGRTPKEASVLGRVGVIEILCDVLRPCMGMSGGSPGVTIADLARVSIGSDDPSEGLVSSRAKFLGRLDRGGFVSESTVESFGAVFQLKPEDLLFSVPSIYERNARTIRRNEGRAREMARRAALKAFKPPNFVQLRTSDAEITQSLLSLLRCKLPPDYVWQIAPDAILNEHTSRFIQAVESARHAGEGVEALAQAVGALETAGLLVWLAHFPKPLPIPLEELDLMSEYVRPPQRPPLIVFTKLGAAPPGGDLSYAIIEG